MDLKPGAVGEVEVVVTPERTADAMGNRGVRVLATPFLIGFLEDAAGVSSSNHTSRRGQPRSGPRSRCGTWPPPPRG